MERLKTMPFDSLECLEGIISRLEGLIKACDGRKMDERLAREFSGMIHELKLVKMCLTIETCERDEPDWY